MSKFCINAEQIEQYENGIVSDTVNIGENEEIEGDEDTAAPGDPDDAEEEPDAEEELEEEPEQPQVITIAAFAELDEEIMYQGFPLPAEGEEPVTVDDMNFPERLEATDTDEDAAEISGVTWVCPDYDFTVMGV